MDELGSGSVRGGEQGGKEAAARRQTRRRLAGGGSSPAGMDVGVQGGVRLLKSCRCSGSVQAPLLWGVSPLLSDEYYGLFV